MDPRRVLTFRAVATERSFSRAAERLSLSQPSVSQQVAALEREVGAKLLDRRPGGLRLTAAGRILLEHADAIAERFELAGAQLRDLAAAARARLKVGAFPTALGGLVPSALDRVRETAPTARFAVDEGTADELPPRVLAGDLHVAILFQDAALPRREHPGLERRDLLHEAFLIALAPDHRLAGRRAVRLADLAEDDWTAASPDGIIVRSCRDAGFEPHLVSMTRDQMAIRSLVGRGLAVTLAPATLNDSFEGVALRPIAGPGPERDVYALLPPGGRHPLVEPFLDALAAKARAISQAY